MRTTVDIPEPLLEAAKGVAADRRITLSAVVEDALRGLLTQRSERDSTPFHLHTVRGRLIRPDLDLDRTTALLLESDEAAFRDQT